MKKDHLEILLEDIRGKFDLVLEGHESIRKEIRDTREELNEKIEHNTFLIGALNRKIDDVDERLSKKIDAVAADLKDHRADTESHASVYRVKEGRD